MAFACCTTAFLVDSMFPSGNFSPSVFVYWKAAMTSALASPIGYESLKYISYPLMILTKSSKPVPVMFVGTIFYNQKYSWYKYVGVALVCIGISLFTSFKAGSRKLNSIDESLQTSRIIYGIFLVLFNLSLDGYTSNEQDHIFSKYSISSLEMMKNTNLWQAIYLFGYLFITWNLYHHNSEASQAWKVIINCPIVRQDILSFCICAAIGQILILCVIREFGSLVWVTVSVTRQLFTILLSVFIFHHAVNGMQWLGVLLVFSGLALEIIFNYISPSSTSKNTDKDPLLEPSTTSTGVNNMSANETTEMNHTSSSSFSRRYISSTPTKDGLFRSLSSVEKGTKEDSSLIPSSLPPYQSIQKQSVEFISTNRTSMSEFTKTRKGKKME
eukprot:CAMPEP_0170094326 /NCGR_PEP_ID=MMETSP0019_2-20121128/27157_1 /TAXON_ID=98059 /ORGANISM="Dinobryon sp., Strain UTEXLB2267" /LENGTH=384 /DNA_ID=CAMNT_0010315571 /DNA_START=151 /DNA_END=1305 /DNA_ORIENTATION=+